MCHMSVPNVLWPAMSLAKRFFHVLVCVFDTCPASRCWFSHSFQMHEPHTGIRHCTICTRLQDGRQAMSSLDKVVNKICLFFCLSSSYVTILIHFLSFILDERIYWTFVSFFFHLERDRQKNVEILELRRTRAIEMLGNGQSMRTCYLYWDKSVQCNAFGEYYVCISIGSCYGSYF